MPFKRIHEETYVEVNKRKTLLMRQQKYPTFVVFLMTLILICAGKAYAFDSKISDKPPVLSKQIIEQWMKEISNWGRWGADDQLGTLNLITPAKRKQAAALVQTGISVSLSLDVNKKSDHFNPSPLKHEMYYGEGGGAEFAMDTYTISYHGYAHSHLDALNHMFYQGKTYNGFTLEDIKTVDKNSLGIQGMKNGIVSRGVLIDIPRLKKIPYLEINDVITVEDIQAWEKQTGITVGSGDVLLIRTGRWVRQQRLGPWNARENLAGLHPSVVKWLKARDVSVLGCDGVSDAFPSPVEGLEDPVHILALVALGMPLFDNLDLEPLAKKSAELNRWEFLFMASPLRVPGGTGSPINPIAIF